jgi:hyperosmotically inducible protein
MQMPGNPLWRSAQWRAAQLDRVADMRMMLRAVLVIVLLLVIGFAVSGRWSDGSWRRSLGMPAPSVGTMRTESADAAEKARVRGAEVGEKVAVVAEEVGTTVVESTITAKIKAKMALDDSIRAGTVNVSTTGSTVTLTGTARSSSERTRMIALARETDGVLRVDDRLALVP